MIQRTTPPRATNRAARSQSAVRKRTRRNRIQGALRKSEARYHALVEAAQDYIYIVDRAGCVEYVNPFAAHALGQPPDCIVGQPISALFPAEIAARQLHVIQQVIDTGQPLRAEEFVPILHGDTWLNTTLVPLLDERGQAYAVLGISRDVTERKRTEDALKESEDRYRDFVEHSQDLICMHELDGRILSVNPTAAKVLRYDPGELLNMNLRDIFAPKTCRSFDQYIATIRKDGAAVGLVIVQTRTGEQRIWEYTSTLRTEGVPVPIVRGTARDITERKRAEDALRESEKRYRRLFDNMLEGFAYCRMIFENGRPLDFVYVEINPAFEQLTGLKNVVGKKVTEVIPGIREFNPEVFERYGRVASTGKPDTFETYLVPLKIWISVSVFCPGKGYFAAVFENITERRRAEEMRALLAAIVENSSEAIVSRALDNTITSWNAAAERIVGYTAAEVIGHDSIKTQPPELQQEIAEYRGVLRAGQTLQNRETVRITKDGRRINIAISQSQIKDDNGNIIGTAAIFRDITERKRVERELEHRIELAQLLEFLARTANEATVPEEAMRVCLKRLCDFGNWTLGRVGFYQAGGGPRFPDHSVWQATDLARFDKFIPAPENCGSFQPKGQLLGVVLGEKRPAWIPDLNEAYGLTRRTVALAHDLHAAFAFPVIVQDEVAAFLEFFADTPRPVDPSLIAASETIAAQLARLIERSRATQVDAQLAAIVQSSNDAIFSRTLDGIIVSWNAAAERMFGWSAKEAIGQSITRLLVPPEALGLLGPILDRVRRGESVESVETIRLRKDGTRFDAQIVYSTIRDRHGRVVAMSDIVRDITEAKRAQHARLVYSARLRQLSQRLQEVGETERRAISRELHDRIGQDLSTLNLMFGMLETQLSNSSPPAVDARLKDMQGLLKTIVRNVRDVMAELHPPALEDYGLLAALRHLVTEFAKRTGLSANVNGIELHPRLPLIVETAIYRISQEALNNIAKHARARNVEVNLDATAEQVMLDIADDGVGFDTGRILQGGRRWGITTMRERAEGAGITFHVESAPGAGTRVVLEAERAAT